MFHEVLNKDFFCEFSYFHAHMVYGRLHYFFWRMSSKVRLGILGKPPWTTRIFSFIRCATGIHLNSSPKNSKRNMSSGYLSWISFWKPWRTLTMADSWFPRLIKTYFGYWNNIQILTSVYSLVFLSYVIEGRIKYDFDPSPSLTDQFFGEKACRRR